MKIRNDFGEISCSNDSYVLTLLIPKKQKIY